MCVGGRQAPWHGWSDGRRVPRPPGIPGAPPTSLHGRLLPRGLPGNIFLVNVYIFGDSWFICGQSVPGERHRAQPISRQGRLGGSPLPWGPGPSFLAQRCLGASPLADVWHRLHELSSSKDLQLAGLAPGHGPGPG